MQALHKVRIDNCCAEAVARGAGCFDRRGKIVRTPNRYMSCSALMVLCTSHGVGCMAASVALLSRLVVCGCMASAAGVLHAELFCSPFIRQRCFLERRCSCCSRRQC